MHRTGEGGQRSEEKLTQPGRQDVRILLGIRGDMETMGVEGCL